MKQNWNGLGRELFGFTKDLGKCSCGHSKRAIVYENRKIKRQGLQEIQAIYCSKCGAEY